MSATATLLAADPSGAVILRAEGDWLVPAAADLDQRLRALDLPRDQRVTLDLSGVERLDTAGAWLVLRTERALAGRGNTVALANLNPNFAPLLDHLRADTGAPVRHPIPPHHTFVGFVARIGEVTIRQFYRATAILGFGGLVTITILNILRQRRRLRGIATVVQIEQTGVDALPIVGLLTFLIGVVMAYQGSDQLRRFGAEIYTVNLLGVAILRELGVLLTAIIVAGRSGSAFTAQIGTMQVNEEIDALRTLGLDPVEVLVLPRLFGLLVALPLLTLYADLMGMLGGMLMSWVTLGISLPQFMHQLQTAVSEWTLWVGVIKAPFFAAIIALVGCFEGFNVSRSAESVEIGRASCRERV
jgi:phospholipid/cholesterol/gamma-HCH transport system permease protein